MLDIRAAKRSLAGMKQIFLITALAFLSGASSAVSHELWIDAQEYQVQSGTDVVADLRNGQTFAGISLAWFDNRIAVMDMAQGDQRTPITGRAGDTPAIRVPAAQEGLMVLAYQSQPSTVSYDSWEKFAAFLEHKDLEGAAQAHRARGLPEAGFKEVYTRYSKALVGVGNGAGTDRDMGFETEFLALSNPYVDDLGDGFAVRLEYQGQVRAQAQIEIFDRARDGTVAVRTVRTDDKGEARIAVTPGHVYLLDAVVLREPAAVIAAQKDAVWESLWAAMTFAVPMP